MLAGVERAKGGAGQEGEDGAMPPPFRHFVPGGWKFKLKRISMFDSNIVGRRWNAAWHWFLVGEPFKFETHAILRYC